MIGIINPVVIVKEHFESLRESASILTLCVLFFLFPAVVAFILVKFAVFPSINFLNSLLTAVSIISALMFSLLFIVLEVGTKIKKDLAEKKQSPLNWRRYKLLRQLLTNVSFSILLGIALILIILTALLLKEQINQLQIMKNIGTWLFYYLSFIYILTLLQILKRSYVLLEHELKL